MNLSIQDHSRNSVAHDNTVKKGRLLAVDTSTAAMSVALLEGEQLVRESLYHAERNHSIFLLPMIHALLLQQEQELANLQAVAVGIGPGSYTGIRIGVTTMKTIAWSCKLPIVGVSSLEAMALGGWETDGYSVVNSDVRKVNSVTPNKVEWIVPLMDARRKQVYTGMYVAAVGNVSQISEKYNWHGIRPDAIRLLAPWLQELLLHARSLNSDEAPLRISFVGEVEAIYADLQEFAEEWQGETSIRKHDIRAYYVGKLAVQRYADNDIDDVHNLVPNYTQLAEAEAVLLAKSK